jgi:hypothetical protein
MQIANRTSKDYSRSQKCFRIPKTLLYDKVCEKNIHLQRTVQKNHDETQKNCDNFTKTLDAFTLTSQS